MKFIFFSSKKWKYDYIQIYGDNYSYIALDKFGSGGLVFYVSDCQDDCFDVLVDFSRIATSLEKKWLFECIKANKLVSKPKEYTNYEIY